ncbi:TPA: hypothetical protein N2D99_002384 [Clostridium botulinum]|nr:hypothetical protein [Clostridium botulinum]
MVITLLNILFAIGIVTGIALVTFKMVKIFKSLKTMPEAIMKESKPIFNTGLIFHILALILYMVGVILFKTLIFYIFLFVAGLLCMFTVNYLDENLHDLIEK